MPHRFLDVLLRVLLLVEIARGDAHPGPAEPEVAIARHRAGKVLQRLVELAPGQRVRSGRVGADDVQRGCRERLRGESLRRVRGVVAERRPYVPARPSATSRTFSFDAAPPVAFAITPPVTTCVAVIDRLYRSPSRDTVPDRTTPTPCLTAICCAACSSICSGGRTPRLRRTPLRS
jgi:hypothetical protein